MGFYAETYRNHNKAATLAAQYGGRTAERDEALAAFEQGMGVFTVVNNGPFEAAAFMFNMTEWQEFHHPEDRRPRTYVIMDRGTAERISGYAPRGGSR